MKKRSSNKWMTGLLLLAMMVLPLQFVHSQAAKKGKDTRIAFEKPVPNKFDTLITTNLVSGLKFRSIGPALTSGRIADFAVNPINHSEFYVGVASGNIWKTTNNGVTFEPVFDTYGSYSIGCLAMDPQNTNVVWAGTGENNHQRALGYGDGVYKTIDGGKTWKNMGLKDSRQIGMILIDPRNSNTVYVAAEGSVWGPGSERGLYKTTDGGSTWTKVLNVSENTGINNVICDPRNPDILYATSEQRRRHVFTKIGGGPETALYKSEDAGKNWRKLTSGLPKEHMGGMGIAISPLNPDVLYLIIEAANEAGGFFRSTDRGESWKKMSDHASSGQYYNEIYCDPFQFDKIYSVETISHYTEDGGTTWKQLGLDDRHVDDHALWINPTNNNHIMIGGDGGIYTSYDSGAKWRFTTNLSVTQFYRVAVDNAEPFYNVYGGTQDNATLGGPSRNLSEFGVTSGEWIVPVFGDGFFPNIDPTDPNIVYAESQYGNLVRYDKRSGEAISIKPQPRKDELTYRWYWDTPVLISPHSPTRLYMASNKVFRSDDRGNTWQVISEDLSSGTDRNTWPVMGKFWSVDAVAKDLSTSLFGTVISLTESPVRENLLFAGTDDGLIQVTDNAGKDWQKTSTFPGVPEFTSVSDILASRFDENVVFAAFNNLKNDDFKPYLLKSTDKGKTWTSIAGNLPNNGTVHTIEQDYINPDLLFVGTEFGIFFTINGGKSWVQLKEGIPTISVRDITIQPRENDLVLATFGRGFYILDNYAALRELTTELVQKEAHLFNVKDALLYMTTDKIYGQGATYFGAPNPEFGATFELYLKEVPKTAKAKRHEEEKKLFDEGKPIPQPSAQQLADEKNEVAPYLLISIRDNEGDVVRSFTQKPSKGIQRFNWDLRYTAIESVGEVKKFDPLTKKGNGIFVMPGTYTVEIDMMHNNLARKIAGPKTFEVKTLNNHSLPAPNRQEMVNFQISVSKLAKSMQGTLHLTNDLMKEIQVMKQTTLTLPDGASGQLMQNLNAIENELLQILMVMNGQPAKASFEEIAPSPLPLMNRLRSIIYAQMNSSSAITSTSRSSYELLKDEFPLVLNQLRTIATEKMTIVRQMLDKANAPYTPGRIPVWK
jgi:photosystem II stability/assembly factor-like uncharacterized protein